MILKIIYFKVTFSSLNQNLKIYVNISTYEHYIQNSCFLLRVTERSLCFFQINVTVIYSLIYSCTPYSPPLQYLSPISIEFHFIGPFIWSVGFSLSNEEIWKSLRWGSPEATVDLPLQMWSPANCLGPLFLIDWIKTQEVESAIWDLLGPLVRALHWITPSNSQPSSPQLACSSQATTESNRKHQYGMTPTKVK